MFFPSSLMHLTVFGGIVLRRLAGTSELVSSLIPNNGNERVQMNQIPFGFSPQGGDGKPFDMSSLGDMLQQLGAAMKRGEADGDSAVSWSTIRDVARQAVSASGDSSIVESQRKAVADAVGLAQMWLDEHTAFPSSSLKSNAWSRAEWVENTLESWKPLINPVAEGLANTVTEMTSNLAAGEGELPEEMKAMLAPMLGMAKKMSAVTTGMQMGNGLAELSADVLAVSETGLPLVPDFVPTLMPNAIATFARENELSATDLIMYIAARESALQRLFAANPWLRTEIADLVAAYSRGLSVDHERIRETMSSIDPSDPSSMQSLMSSGVFQPATTPEQQRLLERLEFLLALEEGWVNHVVSQAVGQRLGSIGALSETMNRRRVAGGPAEKTFANLVGLELRPRLLRTATSFWARVSEARGNEGRDSMWRHPDFLPRAEDLSNPEEFLKNSDYTE